MNKQELFGKIAQTAQVEKKEVIKIMEAFEEVVIKSLQQGEEVTLTGFGTWLAKFRSARGGVNPQNPSERIQVPAVTVPKFRAGKTLKDALKKKEAIKEEEGNNNESEQIED